MAVLQSVFYLSFSVFVFFLGISEISSAGFLSGIEKIETDVFVTNAYNKKVPPIAFNIIEIKFNLMTLNDIDIKAQSMVTTGYIHLSWWDRRFDWSSMPGVQFINYIYLTNEVVWTPTILVKNAVFALDVLGSKKIPIRVSKLGEITWTLPGVFTTSCSIDISSYPAETQTCAIEVTTWGYTAEEVIVTPNSNGSLNMDLYEENGQWESLTQKTYNKTSTREDGDFQSVYFEFTFKRRTTYYILTTILPVCLLSLLCCFVFKLPPDSGERIGYSLTVLLAYAVYLSLIADEIPDTSLTTSVFSVYLVGIFGVGVIAVILTILVLSCHHTPSDEPVPDLVEAISEFCARIVCWKQYCCCRKSRSNAVNDSSSVKKSRLNFDDDDNADENDDDNLNWQDIASIYDRVCLYAMSLIVLGFNISQLYVFAIGLV